MFKKLLLLELELQNWWWCFGRLGSVEKVRRLVPPPSVYASSSHTTTGIPTTVAFFGRLEKRLKLQKCGVGFHQVMIPTTTGLPFVFEKGLHCRAQHSRYCVSQKEPTVNWCEVSISIIWWTILVLVCLEFRVCSIWCEFRDDEVVVQGLGFCIVPFCAQHRWWTLQLFKMFCFESVGFAPICAVFLKVPFYRSEQRGQRRRWDGGCNARGFFFSYGTEAVG